MKRRNFINQTGGLAALGLVGSALSACRPQQSGQSECGPLSEPGKPEFKWKMVTAWPRDFPGLGTGANKLADYIQRLSGGRIAVKIYGGGELIPPFEVFDAVSRGTAELGHGASYYWKGKIPAAQIFAGVPFGLTSQEQNAWLYYGGGLELWQEAYAEFGVIPFPVGSSGTQMGGWFNREINSVDDLVGLKMRIPGLGAEVLKRAGGTPTTIPGAELFTALQTGTIDATEWIGPYNDLAFGLFRAAKYYYYPGWHEPGTTLELTVNSAAFSELPEDLQAIVEIASQAANMDMLSEFTARSGPSLQRLIDEHRVELRQFPAAVLKKLSGLTAEVIADLAASDDHSARAHQSMTDFYQQVRDWTAISDYNYLTSR